MSIDLLRTEIALFLASPQPEVLCLRGKWGVGKTFSWNAFLREAKGNANGIALKSYSYVSLFGIDSLDQLKYSIFENTLPVRDIGVEPSLETFKSNTTAVSERLGRGWGSTLAGFILGEDRTALLQSVAFLSVRAQIICIDDLGRKGGNLSMKDVLGLVAHLKEQKACKVILITNEDELPKGDDRDHFDLYSEKVIDRSIRFSPDACECVKIAIQAGTREGDLLREMVVSLDISNIRVIKKIEWLVERVAPLLEGMHANVLRQAVQSLTLLGWSAHLKNEAPSIDFLRHKRNRDALGFKPREDMTEDERNWNALLDSFGPYTIDEFDLSLLEGIEQGYFDEGTILRRAKELDEKFKAAESEGSLEKSWALLRRSFDDNEEEVVKGILEAFHQHVCLVSPRNLNSTMKFLKTLGRVDEAKEALDYYLDKRGMEGRTFFDLDADAFGDELDDPDMRAAFDAKYGSFKDERSPAQVLLAIEKDHGWSRNDITLLSRLSADDFLGLFKSQKGDNLGALIRASLQFERTGGTSVEERAISAKVREALLRIGNESAINKVRVGRFGVTTE